MTLGAFDVAPPALAGERIVFTGRSSSLGRRRARSVAARLGGTVGDEVTPETTMLVVAGASPAGAPDGDDERCRSLARAEAINTAHGGRVRILSEDEFCALAGLPSPAALGRQWHPLREILEMYPRLREDHVRQLEKRHLIRPTLASNGGKYFSFSDLSVIRQVHAELERGAALGAVVRELQASRQGQLALDFGPDAGPATVISLADAAASAGAAPAVDTEAAEEWFRTAASFDDRDPAGQEAAARAYRRALEIDPYLVPALINLANIHYAREHLVEAEILYQRAISLEPDAFEAHFNLGNVHHDLGRLEDALACYETALGLDANYPDAHFYAAVTLEKMGRSAEARPHWRRYRELAPDGKWISLAREFGE